MLPISFILALLPVLLADASANQKDLKVKDDAFAPPKSFDGQSFDQPNDQSDRKWHMRTLDQAKSANADDKSKKQLGNSKWGYYDGYGYGGYYGGYGMGYYGYPYYGYSAYGMGYPYGAYYGGFYKRSMDKMDHADSKLSKRDVASAPAPKSANADDKTKKQLGNSKWGYGYPYYGGYGGYGGYGMGYGGYGMGYGGYGGYGMGYGGYGYGYPYYGGYYY